MVATRRAGVCFPQPRSWVQRQWFCSRLNEAGETPLLWAVGAGSTRGMSRRRSSVAAAAIANSLRSGKRRAVNIADVCKVQPWLRAIGGVQWRRLTSWPYRVHPWHQVIAWLADGGASSNTADGRGAPVPRLMRHPVARCRCEALTRRGSVISVHIRMQAQRLWLRQFSVATKLAHESWCSRAPMCRLALVRGRAPLLPW